MDQAPHRRMGLVADRVVELVIGPYQLGRIGDELARDRIVRVGGVD